MPFDKPDQFGTSSDVLRQKWYVIPSRSPGTSKISSVPAGLGEGRSVTFVADSQFAAVIVLDECLRSYSVAVPSVPSSPGAVQVKTAEECDVEETARSVTAAGAAESSGLTPVSPCSPHPEVTVQRTATEIDLTKLCENTVPHLAGATTVCWIQGTPVRR
jgi:hypothetical protein